MGYHYLLLLRSIEEVDVAWILGVRKGRDGMQNCETKKSNPKAVITQDVIFDNRGLHVSKRS